ncbi:hypothetical protein BJX99DRAFT_160731 [Aspergillus californicus]
MASLMMLFLNRLLYLPITHASDSFDVHIPHVHTRVALGIPWRLWKDRNLFPYIDIFMFFFFVGTFYFHSKIAVHCVCSASSFYIDASFPFFSLI